MKGLLIALVLLVSAAGGLATAVAQKPPDESNLPDSEKRIPAGHYCKAPDVTIGPRETRAHHCGCKYACSIDEQGNVSEHEDEKCLAYCHANGRRCTCHVEEPCAGSTSGNALMNMAGQVVAMKVRH